MDLSEPDSPPLAVWREYKIPLILGGASVIAIVISIVLLVRSIQPTHPIEFSHTGSGGDQASSQGSISAKLQDSARTYGKIKIDIEGAVIAPGVVSLPSGSRVEDALQAAGGLRATADIGYVAKNINKAMKVADGMKLYIPFIKETSHIINQAESESITSHNINSSAQGSAGYHDGAFVSINMASKDELDRLPGVGPVTAQKIVDNRPYETLEDLVNKKAVGPSVFEKIRQLIML